MFVNPLLNRLLLEQMSILGSYGLLDDFLSDGTRERLRHILRLAELLAVVRFLRLLH